MRWGDKGISSSETESLILYDFSAACDTASAGVLVFGNTIADWLIPDYVMLRGCGMCLAAYGMCLWRA